ncbi:MAG: hypothetical protein RIF32_03885 [Leptospirales bacterium]|jgi:lysophospholipid acyltransferase (LPLAT)-like uncharacterized protein
MGLPKHPIRRRLYQSSTSLASGLSSILLSIYQATLDYIVEGDDHLRILDASRKNYIIAVWHTFVDAAIFGLHSRGVCIYSDHPRTKQYETSWTHYFREIGIKTIRGMGYEVLDASLGKQSQGIINFIKIIKDGTPALVAPDGPHGPIYEAKPGVIYMARKSGSVVVPVGMGFSRRVIGPNWDDFALPLPFSRVGLVVGEPIEPAADTDENSLARQALDMEKRLDELCFRANDIVLGRQ